jgi:3-phosphoshikimate 1-carboxyvinyltransferase
MNSWVVRPSQLKGRVEIPPSKSQSIRALLFALLARGRSVIENLLPSPDVEAMLVACQMLGASVEKYGDRVEVVGKKIHSAEDVIQAGNSGLILRLIGAVSALGERPIVITGDYSIRHVRPVTPLLEALNQLGVQAFSLRGDGGAPILVKGPLQGGSAILSGEDSQPVSGLLIASAFAPGPIEIFVTRPGEKPWIDLTLSWLKRFGIPYTAQDYTYYKLEGNAAIEPFSYTVPVDFSSLSYPLLGAILTGSEVKFENLDFSDPQGDKKVIEHLQKMGAEIEVDHVNKSLYVKKGAALQGISVDVNDCIDATPLLAVAGCFAEGKTELKGAGIARKKECDRIGCIVQELKKMGAKIEEHPEGLTIYRSPLKGAEVLSHADHRIALSLAIAGLKAKGETVIRGVDCAIKSYPLFCEQLQRSGGDLRWQ